MGVLLEGKSYAERRGAAYGIGGFIKGLGTLAMQVRKIDQAVLPFYLRALHER